MSNRACDGASTKSVWKNMEQCRKCKTCVRHDLVSHPFWGFQNCREKATSDPAIGKSSDGSQAIGSATKTSSLLAKAVSPS